MDHIVIIGNGIAGVTTARHVRKNGDHRITIISGETDHFFSRTALMYIYMGHMKYEHTKPYQDDFWKKNRIDLISGWVTGLSFDNKEITLDSGEKIKYDKLVLATGSVPNKFGWPGQDADGVRGLYSFQDLEYMEAFTGNIERAVIVGGGLIGVEMAEMLHSRKIPVTFLVRETGFWRGVLPEEEADLITRHLREQHIDLRLGTEMDKILTDDSGRARAVVTKDGEEIPCQYVGLTAGVRPNVKFLEDSGLEINRGILVDDYLQTNIPDVYAAGDCSEVKNAQPGRRPIEAVWYVGRMMGETLGRTLNGMKTAYNPGIWFNSAKFFDIEYQTYGLVLSELQENQKKFYWEAENGQHCVKIVYDRDSRVVKGINTFGIRMRHEVWNNWLKAEKTLDYVVENLLKANFDPEFFKKHETEIQEKYNLENPGHPVKVRKRSVFEKIFS